MRVFSRWVVSLLNAGTVEHRAPGNIIKDNRFVRNLASVLRINPGRIRVTNIVPGNRRRLRSGAGSDLDIRFDIAEVDPCESSSKKCAGGSGRRRLSEQASFRELIAVADDLVSQATNGTLDTGYTVSSLATALPTDECGVPGGNSSTCDDACGVPNGDSPGC